MTLENLRAVLAAKLVPLYSQVATTVKNGMGTDRAVRTKHGRL